MKKTDFLTKTTALNKQILDAIKDEMRKADKYIIDFDEDDAPYSFFYFESSMTIEDCMIKKIELLDNSLTLTFVKEGEEYESADNWGDIWVDNTIQLCTIYDSVYQAIH